MINGFNPNMIILSGTIEPGKTGDYNYGFEDGETRLDPDNNEWIYLVDGELGPGWYGESGWMDDEDGFLPEWLWD